MQTIDFIWNVYNWSTERNLFRYSNQQAQWLKAVSEFGELADAIVKDRPASLRDAIGDSLVCLVNMGLFEYEPEEIERWFQVDVIQTPHRIRGVEEALRLLSGSANSVVSLILTIKAVAQLASAYDQDLGECLQMAWDAIKDRRGSFSESGAFVKEGDV